MKEGDVKAIIFDVGGVLQTGGNIRLRPSQVHTSGVHEYIAKKLGITLDQYLDSIDTYYAKSIEGQIDRKTLLKVLSLNLNYPTRKLVALYHKAYKKRFKRNNKLYALARKLKKKGYKIAILSDQWHLSKDVFIPERDAKIFDAVVVSCDVGMRKPNPEIYKMVLKKLKVKPEEAIFVDNQAWNIVPAHKLGMKTILYQNIPKTKKQLKDFGIKL